MLRHLTALLLLGALSFGAGLGRPALTESDEAYYAEAAREMVERGDWLTPHFNYEFRFQKPILYYWLAAGAYAAAGVSEAASRLPSALAGIALALTTYFAGRRAYDADTGFLAGAMVATNFGYVSIGRQALPDLLLTAFIALATWCLLEWAALHLRGEASGVANGTGRVWVLAGSAAMAAAFLTKGPVGLILPLLIVGPIMIVEAWRSGLRGRSLGRLVPPMDLAVGLGAFLLIVTPWYAAMVREHGTWYLQHFFVGENLERFATDRYNDPRPVWFYLPVLVGGLLPWSPFLLLLAPPLVGVLTRRRSISNIEMRLTIWAVAPLLFYTASIGKQPRYILPVMPPLAILVARAISTRLAVGEGRQCDRLLLTCAVLTSLVLLAVPLGLIRMDTMLRAAGYPGAVPFTVVLLIAAGLVPMVATAAGARRSFGLLMAAAAATALVTVQYVVFSPGRPAPVERMAEAVLAHRASDEPVVTYGVFERNLVFYTRIQQADVFSEEALIAFLRSPTRVLGVVDRNILDRLTREQHLRVRPLFEVRDFDPLRLRLDRVLSSLIRRQRRRDRRSGNESVEQASGSGLQASGRGSLPV